MNREEGGFAGGKRSGLEQEKRREAGKLKKAKRGGSAQLSVSLATPPIAIARTGKMLLRAYVLS